ncbi:MAG: DUF721 domain-containing protein [Verrucomicrobiae bacterium]|jgi:predicted nucleic acid-binding Zn ribbon protein|nr:DUF721 domain-containing protein [Verrucomicrobiae bacterium]
MSTSRRNRTIATEREAASERAATLAAWRGVDLRPLEIARRDNTRPMGDLVKQVLNKVGLDRKQAETEIVKVWNEIIDPTITVHAQPDGIRNGTLFVNVSNSVWLSEIVRYHRRDILQRLQTSFGKKVIARISFRAG